MAGDPRLAHHQGNRCHVSSVFVLHSHAQSVPHSEALEGRGLINRIKTPDDGRRQLIQLSDQGRDLFDAMWERSAEIYKEIEDECGKELIEDVLDGLKRIQMALHT